MVHNNKILTVSYGTFSCTLEGFDDSFGTMKAIAEYFRDLAADDRYFGAEPPQPDADMLARIAQRAIVGKVEAHENDDGIVLRAKDLQPAPATLATPAAEAAPAPEAAPVAKPEPEIAPETVAAPAAEPMADAETAPETAQQDIAPETHTEATEPAAATAEPEQSPPMPASMDIIDAVDEGIAEFAAPAPEIAEKAPAADSIAAKLQRIRAVVSQNEAVTSIDDYSEDEHADAFVPSATTDITSAMQNDTTAMQDEYEDTLGAQAPVGDDEISLALDRLDEALAEDGGTGQSDESTAMVLDMVSETLVTTTVSASVEKMTDAPDETEEPEAEDASLFGDLEDDDDIGDDEEVSNILSDDDTPGAPQGARIVKVKRAEVDAAIAAGDLEEIEDEDLSAESSLSPDDEDELLRELAAVEAELLAGEDEDEDIDEPDAAEHEDMPEDDATGDADESTRIALTPTVDTEEEDLSRLMATVDQKMEDPETTSSRDTYSQLRAAVAAAEAEKSAGGSITPKDEGDAYREDLADVVRPRRPVAAASRPARPHMDSKPAPLKLVAEQRVDSGAGQATRGPVRPRRVATSLVEEEPGSQASKSEGGFAEYAAEMGATELSELLEAAAAYMSFVEGRAQFSRPQLMNKVRQLDTSEFNREDGLRSFGQLLRQGKIEKTGGGRFTASGDIGFRPDELEAG